MRFLSLELAGFKVYRDPSSVSFSEGLNLFIGPNRAGKSTLLEAVLVALYGPSRERAGRLSRALLRSWAEAEVSRVGLTYEAEGEVYRIERDLSRGRALMSRARGDGAFEALTSERGRMEELLSEHTGFPELSLLTACAFIRQGELERVGRELSRLGSFLQRVLTGGGGGDVERALELLVSRRRELRAATAQEFRPTRPREYERLEEKLREFKAGLVEAEELEREVRRLGGIEENLKGVLPEKEKRLDELRSLLFKAARKQELERELEENLRKAEGVDSRLKRLKEIRDELEAFEKTLKDLGSVADSVKLIREELPRWEGELESLTREQAERESKKAELREKLKGLRQERDAFKALDPHQDGPSVLEEETLLRLDLKREELKRRLSEVSKEEAPLPSSSGIALSFALGLLLVLAPTILKILLARPLPPYGMVLYALGLLPIYWGVLQLNRRLFIAKARSRKSHERIAIEEKLGEVERELQKVFDLLGCSEIEEARAIRIRMREFLRLQEEATRELERLESDGLRKEKRAFDLREKVEALLSRTGADDPQSLKGHLLQWEGLARRRELLLTQRREIEGEEGEAGLKREQETLDRRRRELRLEVEEEDLTDFHPSIEEEEAWKREARKLEDSSRKEKEELLFTQGRLRELTGKLRSPDAIREEIEEVEERKSELDFLYGAHLLAEETLGEAWGELEGEYLPALEERLNYYFRRAVPEEFDGVELARAWPQLRLRAGAKEDVRVEALSHATAEQLYLTLRLALLELLSRGGTPPLFLDDPLTNYDPASLERVWPILSDWARAHQLFFLTCHPQYLERGRRLKKDGVPVRLFTFEGRGKLEELPL